MILPARLNYDFAAISVYLNEILCQHSTAMLNVKVGAGCLVSSAGRALAFHCCISGLMPGIHMQDGNGYQMVQDGFPPVVLELLVKTTQSQFSKCPLYEMRYLSREIHCTYGCIVTDFFYVLSF